jgi:molybdopterin-containing oxidoreductase family membrane subunit
MSDRAYWPEGVERCSVGKFLAWLGVISIFLAWGGYGAFKVLGTGIGVTGLDNYFGFGLWITFDLAVIALGAGAFFSGFLRYIIRIDELKNIINLAVIVGFLCYSGAMLVLVLDIGQPLRAWFGYWHPNVHSMLTEVIFCITCYCTVLIIEYVPIILENRKINENRLCHHIAHNFHVYMPLFAGIGTFLSFFHQGSLGGMYGVLFGRPFVFREGFFIWPWTFFLFISSAIASGPGFTMLCAALMETISGRKLVSYETKKLMGKISGLLLCVYIFFKIIDTYAWAKGILPGMGLTFDQMYNSEYGYGQILLWLELFWFGLIPAVMLITPWVRERPALMYTAAIMTAIGVTINRFVFTVQALAIPVMPFDRWTSYAPNWAEWSTSGMIVAYGFLVMSLSYRYLPIFPQEVKLNK